MRPADKLLPRNDIKLVLDEPDSARDMFGRLYEVTNIDVQPHSGGEFAWEWMISPRGATTIIQGHARTGAAMLGGVPPFYVVTLAQEGSIDLSSGTQRANVLPNMSGAIVNANNEVTTYTTPGTRTLNVRIDSVSLHSHLTALVGMPVNKPLHFDLNLDLRQGYGADMLRLAQLLADAAARPEAPLGSPHVIAHFREALFSMLLTGQQSTVSHFFRQPVSLVNARVVRVAEEIIDARATEPVSIAEIAAATGISLRSLERTYKEARGQTLRDFLKSRRLELAHRRLATAAPGTTVTQVLYASGFSHAGEFSRAYRERFGTTPSETLRQALHGNMSVAKSR